tara:strand:- start:3399 stop:4787 length:1389 start_codon:yes stop_codon:yes gene_type:complete
MLLLAAPAAHADSGTSAIAAASTSVAGEPWSSPAHPVNCEREGNQVSCTPTDPSFVVAQQCYLGVAAADGSAVVCTTYEQHRPAIEARGGKPTLVDYGCGFGDLVCTAFEGAGRAMAVSATGAMFLMATTVSFNTDSVLWDAATGEWAFWRWAVAGVIMIAIIIAVVAAAARSDRDDMVSAIVRSLLAVPMVSFTLWMTGLLVNIVDDLTWYALAREGIIELFRTLQSVMWAGGHAAWFFAFLMHGLLLIGMLLLIFVFMFRNLGLAALVAIGPIAWMLFPIRSIGMEWVTRYVAALATLLLTGPLTIGFVSLIVRGLAQVQTIWDPAAWPLVFGLVLVAFAPFAIFGLFSFVGGVAVDALGSRAGAGAVRSGTNITRQAMRFPTRHMSTPAGARAIDRRSPTGGRPSSAGDRGPTGRTDRSTAPQQAPASRSETRPPQSPRTERSAPAQPTGPQQQPPRRS